MASSVHGSEEVPDTIPTNPPVQCSKPGSKQKVTGSVSTKRQRKSLVSSESPTGRIQGAEKVEKLPRPAIIITTPWPKGSKEDAIMSTEVHPPALEEVVEKMEGVDLKVKMEVPKMEEPTKRPQRRVKGLKMPDGTYVGIKDKNKYLSAMQKEHLKCDYAPFCILIVLAATVIILVYLQTYRPDVFNSIIEGIRKLLGMNTEKDASHQHGGENTTSGNGGMHVEAYLGKTKTAITFPDVSPSIKNNHDEQRVSG